MKQVISILALLIFLTVQAFSSSGDRQKVFSIIKQKQAPEWYLEQAGLWETYLETHPNDADAWLNFYTAKRMLKLLGKDVNQDDLNDVVERIKKRIPNTFEYHYIAHWNGGAPDSEEHKKHLARAIELGPNRVEILDALVTQYEVERDIPRLVETANRWYDSNDISPGLYAWNYNVLQSTDRDAILITSGDNDTYPALVLQYAKGIRTDVAVINNTLISIKSYRERYFRELGIPPMSVDHTSFHDWKKFHVAIVDHIRKNTTRPLYFAVSARPFLFEEYKSDVYNVGMAYKWSEQKFDNIAVLKRNFEKKYLTDYLKLDCYNDISQGVVDQMNTNYLVSLLTLYNHYEESEDDRLMDVGYIINRIADRNQLQDQVSAVLKGKPDYTVSLVVDDPRTLEKDFVKVNDTLYAGKTEVTNAMYELFLTDMLKQKRFDDLDEARSNAVDWRAYLPLEKKALSDEEIFPHGKPTSDHFPVVNISHHAAELYCQWLTAVYNGLDHKRKKHVKVEFRLPTEQEWEFLAQGGDTGRVYPWGGPYVRNSKGCFIANLKTASSQGNNLDCASNNVSDADGGYFPVRADSYFPNAYGLFNMTGNVAEMVSETSLCKGGGWNTKPSKAKIKSKNEMTGPSPEIGFRVIMVIQ